MIKLFSSRQPIVFVILILLIFPIRLPAFLSAADFNTDITSYTFFGNFFLFINNDRLTRYILGCVIVLLQTLHLNYIFEKHRVHYKSTFLPAFFYIVYASLFNAVDSRITPSLLVQTPLMLVLGIYFDLYKSGSIRTKIFTALFVLGLGTLLYFPLGYLMIAFLVSLFFVKIPSFRDFIVAIAGALLPLYFAFVFFYFTGNYSFFVEKANLMTQFKNNISLEESHAEIALLVALGLIIISTSLRLYMNHFKNIIKTRIIQQMLFTISLITLLELIFLLQFQYQHLLLFIIPFSYLLSYFFIGKWRFYMNEIIATALMFFVLLIKIYHL